MLTTPQPMMTSASLHENGASGVERRRYPRRNIALDVSFAPAGAAGALGTPALKDRQPPKDQWQRTVTVDVSIGGMCVYTNVFYPVGTRLVCSVAVPNAPTPVELVATVAWFQRMSQETHDYKLGLECSEITVADRALLERVVLEAPVHAATRSKTVLLVDDDYEFVQAMKVRFQSVGFHVLTATEGVEALQKSRTEHPHLIILDLMLPKLNGYEICRLLKFDQKFQHIPIIMLSARARQQDRELGLSAGADAYVTKPFDGQALFETVETVLAKSPR